MRFLCIFSRNPRDSVKTSKGTEINKGTDQIYALKIEEKADPSLQTSQFRCPVYHTRNISIYLLMILSFATHRTPRTANSCPALDATLK
jgi:hypothetical protein